jgi:orotidine-5'-phosphate decarboxylase
MVDNFNERLTEKIKQKGSIACMGYDPERFSTEFQLIYNIMQETWSGQQQPKYEFAKELIDELKDQIACIKINTRFFHYITTLSENHNDINGCPTFKSERNELKELRLIVHYAHKHDLEVIGDCKENDIGNTMAQAYEKQFEFNFDAITVNAYFGNNGIIGDDNVDIFKKWADRGKGLFVLIKTSNPSSGQFQDLFAGNISGIDNQITEFNSGVIPLERNYIKMAKIVQKMSEKYDNVIGGVVGATYPIQFEKIRKILLGYILLAGYGSQGGTGGILSKTGENTKNIVNSSRAVMYAINRRFKGSFAIEDFTKASLEEIKFMNNDLNQYMKY